MPSKDLLKSLTQQALMPQEEMLEVQRKKGSLYIGIPKETSFQENRVPLVPEAVALLVNNGHKVVVETGAGLNANFQDNDYSEAGAEIAYDTEKVYKANIVLKVEPPSLDEIKMMHRNQTLLSALQLTPKAKAFVRELMTKKVSAIGWDYIQDEDQIFPVVRSMGEIAGNTAILIAAEYLSKNNDGQGMMLGGISGVAPAEVVILGAGTVAEYSARAALGLGANVKVFDDSIYRLRRLQNNVGQRLFTSTLQPKLIGEALKSADVAIGAIRAKKARTPCVVTEEMVSDMKFGSVIIDVAIDQGGCFETSTVTNHDKPVFTKYGITHYCVPNIASRVPRTASHALSNIFAPILLNIGAEGGIENMIRRDVGVRNGVYLYKGTLTNEYIGKFFDLPYKNLDLLLAAF